MLIGAYNSVCCCFVVVDDVVVVIAVAVVVVPVLRRQDRLFWTLEFGTTVVKTASLNALFNLSCTIRGVRDQISKQISRVDQLARAIQCRELGIRVAACKLIGAMLLDGSDFAPLRLSQVTVCCGSVCGG